MKGTIIGFKVQTVSYAAQGIKGGRPYQNTPVLGGYYNGAGAWCSYPERLLFVVWRTENGKVESQNIRDYVKQNASQKRITDNYLSRLREANIGRIVYLQWDSEDKMRKVFPLSQIQVV